MRLQSKIDELTLALENERNADLGTKDEIDGYKIQIEELKVTIEDLNLDVDRLEAELEKLKTAESPDDTFGAIINQARYKREAELLKEREALQKEEFARQIKSLLE